MQAHDKQVHDTLSGLESTTPNIVFSVTNSTCLAQY